MLRMRRHAFQVESRGVCDEETGERRIQCKEGLPGWCVHLERIDEFEPREGGQRV
jgi:hypothetical protein